MIGYAVIDLDGLKDYGPEGRDWTKRHWADYFFCHQSEIPLQGRERVMDPLGSGDDMGSLLSLIRHLEGTGQKLELYFSDSFAAVIGYNRHRFVVPVSTVKCEPLKEYAELPGEELPVPGLLPAKAPSGSVASIRLERSEVENALKSLEKEADAIRTCDSPQMADLKAELDALMERIRLRQTKLLEEQEKEKKALAEKKKELEKRLFILETNIYGIRCYLGEVTSFYTVRDGKSAPEEMPVVIYQKVRFLDEELGKYVSLFGFGDGKGDKAQLLELLKYRDDIADILCPGPKSISAVKISRTGTVKALSRYVANMLQDYRMYHENQLAVLIRNGEQIHIAWLDAKKINISDDSIFYGNSDTESEPFEEGGYFQERTLQKEREKARREMLSRWFFFTILQGVIDNSSLISLPGKVRVTGKDSPYVRFSLADGWLTEDRYGSFADMLKKSSHIPLAKGDTVLTGAILERDDAGSQYNVWSNNRGIGDRNRTYGLHLPGMELIRVNKVIPSISVRLRLRLYRAYIEAEYAGDDTDPACRRQYKKKGKDMEKRQLEKKELEKILADHGHWIEKDCPGWEGMRADLSFTDLRYADLRDRRLAGADIRCADLRYANLDNADLRNARLLLSDLSGANLKNADLRHAFLSGAILEEADLYGADMRGIKALHADMSGAKLVNAKLCRADLTEADLTGAIIDCADLNSAKLEKARLCGAIAHIVKMQGCCLKDADLRGTDLSPSESGLKGSCLEGAVFEGTVEYCADPEQKDKEAEVEDIAEGLGKLLRELLRLCGLQDPS